MSSKVERIMDKIIAFIGCGFVGGAAGRVFAERGLNVVFCDPKPDIRGSLSREGHVVCRPEKLTEVGADVYMVSVPTLTTEQGMDTSYIEEASINIAKTIRGRTDFPLIVVRSTVLPGMTDGLIKPLLEKYSGLIAGEGFGLCMNPEYLREGERAIGDFKNPRLILIGELNPRSGRLLEAVYRESGFDCNISRVSLGMAEAQKYVHNLTNAVAISWNNELRIALLEGGLLTDREIDEVLKLTTQSAEACYNPMYGRKNLGAFAKSCLPKDTSAFQAFAGDLGIEMPILTATINVNSEVKRRWNADKGEIGPVATNVKPFLVQPEEDEVDEEVVVVAR
jgi:UDPglucose 6-dehydrogenase